MQQIFIASFCLFSVMTCFEVTEACSKSECGDNGPAIHIPFHRGHHCGSEYSECSEATYGDEKQMVLVKFFVKHIDYIKQEVQVHNPDNCLLLYPIDIPNTTMPYSAFETLESARSNNITLFSCPAKTVKAPSSDYYYVQAVPCLSDTYNKIYALNSDAEIGDVASVESCTKMFDVLSFYDGYQTLRFKWSEPNCSECEAHGRKCRLKKSKIECVQLKKPSLKSKLVVIGSTLGTFFVLLLAIAIHRLYTCNRNETEHQFKVIRFLEDYKAFKPSRYSYADIKRITNVFKEKLGEGAYGTVYKGSLSSEFFVAVKVLNNSKGDGEEFVNEVGAMGHIHHINVVRMVGFCADGYRRALVYEYFSNGSLQDYISSADNNNGFLGWDKLKDISLGIAKGLEYLHQGCDQRIVHFDIKPHNVLLDHNFTPKISDFGLAKLCSKDQSFVSMTTARGTMGYIAPEVFSRNFGNVSYKSDVYSFGVLLLEIVGGRKNIGPNTNNASDIYYPEWIYNLLEEGQDLRVHIGEEVSDTTVAKELAIVGLWCIQWHPLDRPCMKVVVQMLEGRENLSMPPNPFGSAASAGPSTTNASVPALRRLNLELEAIAELE